MALALWTFFVVVLVLLVRSKIRADRTRLKDRHLSEMSQIESNTTEGGHSHVYFVTRDPVKYAQIFVPEKSRD